jgi:hypothetical protein
MLQNLRALLSGETDGAVRALKPKYVEQRADAGE